MAKKGPKLPQDLLEPIITPEGWLSFPDLFTPSLGMNDSPPLKYRGTILFAEGTDLSKLYARLQRLMQVCFADNPQAEAIIASFAPPVKDSRLKTNPIEGYDPGTFYITASSPENQQPDLIQAANGQQIIKAADIQAGDVVRFALRPYIPWDYCPPWKVAWHLGAVLRVKADKSFGPGKIDGKKAFAEHVGKGAPPPPGGAPPPPGGAPAASGGIPAWMQPGGAAKPPPLPGDTQAQQPAGAAAPAGQAKTLPDWMK